MNKNKFFWQNADSIPLLVELLRNNKILVTSTDTILGFLSNLTQDSFDKLNELKKERSHKPYLILISSINKLTKFVDISDLSDGTLRLMKQCWPGPLTIIFKSKNNLPSFLVSDNKTIAIRIPRHDGLKELLKFFDGLFSTSANRSGKIPPKKINDLDLQILNEVSGVVLDKWNLNKKLNVDMPCPLDQTLPSSIIDLSNRKEVVIVREGAYSIKKMEEYYGSKFKKRG
ncbi:L-threonylcarbamoyladenylate synthase [Candidatus Dependentiae bacterium]